MEERVIFPVRNGENPFACQQNLYTREHTPPPIPKEQKDMPLTAPVGYPPWSYLPRSGLGPLSSYTVPMGRSSWGGILKQGECVYVCGQLGEQTQTEPATRLSSNTPPSLRPPKTATMFLGAWLVIPVLWYGGEGGGGRLLFGRKYPEDLERGDH